MRGIPAAVFPSRMSERRDTAQHSKAYAQSAPCRLRDAAWLLRLCLAAYGWARGSLPQQARP